MLHTSQDLAINRAGTTRHLEFEDFAACEFRCYYQQQQKDFWLGSCTGRIRAEFQVAKVKDRNTWQAEHVTEAEKEGHTRHTEDTLLSFVCFARRASAI